MISSPASSAGPSPVSASASETDAWLSSVARNVVAEFSEKGLREDGLAIALVDRNRNGKTTGSYRGDAPFYPASVVKLFFLAYYESQKESGSVKDTPELVRAVKDMITISSNDATGFVVDSITGTTSGPELSGAEWDAWRARRNAVNIFFEKRGYRAFNANQKTFCEDAYGREQMFRDEGKNRNSVTPNTIARLFRDIFSGQIAGPAGTQEMLGLLARDVAAEKPFEEMESEDARLAGHALPAGTKVWAKSGDAYDVHHLVARVLLPGGADFVLAVFTRGVKTVPGVIPSVFQKVASQFEANSEAGSRPKP